MALEIERRFLVRGEEWRLIAEKGKGLRQGYLASSVGGWTIRVRIIAQEEAWLTLKKQAKGIANHEFEYLIPLHEAESIWELITHKLTKTRYELNLKGGNWVVDTFHGKNSSLVIAEVELSTDKENFQKPTWCGEEITGQYQWSNASLAEKSIWEYSVHSRLETQNQ